MRPRVLDQFSSSLVVIRVGCCPKIQIFIVLGILAQVLRLVATPVPPASTIGTCPHLLPENDTSLLLAQLLF